MPATNEMRRALLAAAIAVAFFAGSPKTDAAPMETSLSTVEVESTDVVIGTLGADPLDIDVDTVVRGRGRRGVRHMVATPGETPRNVSGRVIAFIDQDNHFRWVGNLVAGGAIETGVINLSGFYDYNAHFVYPSMMTFAQLTNYLATGKLQQHFEIQITAADGTGAFPPTGESFQIDFDGIHRKTAFTGLRGACLEQGSLSGLWSNRPAVTLRGTCPGKERTLYLEGAVTGANANGDILFSLSPHRPFLDQKELATYFNDASLGYVEHTAEVRLDDRTTWRWSLTDGAFVDPAGTRHEPTSSGGGRRNGVRYATFEYEPEIELLFEHTTLASWASDMSAGVLPRVDAGTMGSCTLKEAGKPDRSCTLRRGPAKFIKR